MNLMVIIFLWDLKNERKIHVSPGEWILSNYNISQVIHIEKKNWRGTLAPAGKLVLITEKSKKKFLKK